jgi:hypothetical protein
MLLGFFWPLVRCEIATTNVAAQMVATAMAPAKKEIVRVDKGFTCESTMLRPTHLQRNQKYYHVPLRLELLPPRWLLGEIYESNCPMLG